jgi:3'-phosphoadenosine 5'-phosphosulfate sulfotransferase (PAPS reductase)/FAD synthetase
MAKKIDKRTIAVPIFDTKEFVQPAIDAFLYDDSVKILLCFSGGKDSIAMFLHLLELGISVERIELHHHLVDGRGDSVFDWACTESYCRAFAAHFGVNIVFSYRKRGIMGEIYKENKPSFNVIIEAENGIIECKRSKTADTRLKFPAQSNNHKTRWCSSLVKMSVFNQVLTNLPRYQKNVKILVLTGERAAESKVREQYELAQWHTTNAKARKKRIVLHHRLIHNWTDEDVWSIIKRHSVQVHPAYELGWSRCSCQLCIFSNPNVWASIQHISLEKIQYIGDTEVDLNFTMYQKQKIYERVALGKSFVTDENYYRWAYEATTIFTSPIIIDNWKMPQGASSKEESGSV